MARNLAANDVMYTCEEEAAVHVRSIIKLSHDDYTLPLQLTDVSFSPTHSKICELSLNINTKKKFGT
jgi:hypothetical protein